jgi:hypothetical protein
LYDLFYALLSDFVDFVGTPSKITKGSIKVGGGYFVAWLFGCVLVIIGGCYSFVFVFVRYKGLIHKCK